MICDPIQIAQALEAEGHFICRDTQDVYHNPYFHWFNRNGAFCLHLYRQLDMTARIHGITEILPNGEYIRGLADALLTAEEKMKADILLTECAMRVVMELQSVGFLAGYAHMSRKNVNHSNNLAYDFYTAIKTNKLAGWLNKFAPTHLEYQNLVKLFSSVKDAEEI